jgi:oligopeptide transport system ATP-binding protein
VSSPDTTDILRADGLSKRFARHRGFGGGRGGVLAVDAVTFSLREGETLAIVGESGSGKTTVARMLACLDTPTAGAVYLRNDQISGLSERRLGRYRPELQVVFQDPYSSLHPRRKVTDIIAESWHVHPGMCPPRERRDRTAELLQMVGLSPQLATKYASQLSGGERQRVALARTLAMRPKVIILDEPVSALDVSIQAQVIQLFMQLQSEFHLSYVFISHDLSLVRLVADRVIVMNAGRIVECEDVGTLYSSPKNEYTKKLLAAIDHQPPSPRNTGEMGAK